MIGVLATVFGKSPEEQKAELRKRYIQESTAKQQKDANIDCTALKADLSAFLIQQISPIIDNRKAGEIWGTRLTEETKISLRKFKQHLSLCGSLYVTGDGGTLNGLTGVRFADEITNSYITLEVYIKYEGSESCTGKCLDYKFQELKEAYLEVLKALK